MPKEQDRHVGRRENIWFSWEENEQMLNAMRKIGSCNKSEFVRSAVRTFINIINEKKGED